jgi:hypothetical protein
VRVPQISQSIATLCSCANSTKSWCLSRPLTHATAE